MNSFKLSQRSKDRLKGVHPDLVAVVNRAIQLTSVDFGATEGLRSKERQAELVAQKKSLTYNSRHLTGHAVDVVAYLGKDISWEWSLYEEINKAFQQAAKELGVKIVWGGSWTSLKDGPHFELDRKEYPA